MVGEGHGRGARSGATGQGADAARRPRRSADERHQSGQDESAAVVALEKINGNAMNKRILLALAVGFACATSANAQERLSKIRVAYDGIYKTSGAPDSAGNPGIFHQ